MVVNEAEQERLTTSHHGPMQSVADPAVIWVGCFEPAERLRCPPVRAGGQLQPGEVPQQGTFRRRPPRLGAQDPRDLGAGAFGPFPLERGGQLKYLGRSAWGDLAPRWQQGVEPTRSPRLDPPVQSRPGHHHVDAERSLVDCVRQRSDQPASLLGRQVGIGRVPDELVTPQRHLLGALRPSTPLVID